MEYFKKWIECECCGRTHEYEPLDVDCRSFKICEKCGDGYHIFSYDEHYAECNGYPHSFSPEAIFVDINENDC